MTPRLGVNIDHIATLRQARGEIYPDPIESLKILKSCGVSQVTAHLREDRRHIQDADVERLMAAKILPVNLELGVIDKMLEIALTHKPKMVTLVPEKRYEITTEGGLNCLGQKPKRQRIAKAIERLRAAGIHVSVFIDPHVRQVQAAQELGAEAVEIHTGHYCHLAEQAFLQHGGYETAAQIFREAVLQEALLAIETSTGFAKACGLKVYAGHGLHRFNLAPIVRLRTIEEYNIGHAIVSRAVFVGLKQAVMEIQKILKRK